MSKFIMGDPDWKHGDYSGWCPRCRSFHDDDEWADGDTCIFELYDSLDQDAKEFLENFSGKSEKQVGKLVEVLKHIDELKYRGVI